MSLKFSQVDPLSFSDHYYLNPGDTCYYLGEYTARRPYSFSDTNRLIHNLKKRPTASSNELYYKALAIDKVAGVLRRTLTAETNLPKLKKATLVPIPPSAIEGDPLYDNRMTRILTTMGSGLQLDIRELVKQHSSVSPAHECLRRPTPDELYENYYIDANCADPKPEGIWIFDDLLTAGTHFKAMQRILNNFFPDVPMIGIFVARRVPEAADPEDQGLLGF